MYFIRSSKDYIFWLQIMKDRNDTEQLHTFSLSPKTFSGGWDEELGCSVGTMISLTEAGTCSGGAGKDEISSVIVWLGCGARIWSPTVIEDSSDAASSSSSSSSSSDSSDSSSSSSSKAEAVASSAVLDDTQRRPRRRAASPEPVYDDEAILEAAVCQAA